jgi:membrane protease YdiL (CAAX protease family)
LNIISFRGVARFLATIIEHNASSLHFDHVFAFSQRASSSALSAKLIMQMGPNTRDERLAMIKSSQRTVKKTIAYVVITFALSSVFYYLIISSGGLTATGGAYAAGLMWCPGIAAFATQIVYRESLRDLGWRWGKTRYLAWSYLIPLLYASSAYVLVWSTGLGRFSGVEFARGLTSHFGLHHVPTWIMTMGYLVVIVTIGTPVACITALGEETGWRGFLVPNLAKLTTYPRVALISGAIWSVWHYPLLFFADYNAGTPPWYGATCFTVMVIGLSFAFAWMRLKSESLWTAVFLHASHNFFIQRVFDPLTTDTGLTRYVTGEFGVALAVISLIVAYIFWRKRAELP